MRASLTPLEASIVKPRNRHFDKAIKARVSNGANGTILGAGLVKVSQELLELGFVVVRQFRFGHH